MNLLKRIGEAAVVGLSAATVTFAMSNLLKAQVANPTKLPVTAKKPPRVYVSIFEKQSGEFVVANMEIIGEESDGRGHYVFHLPKGRLLELDLSHGAFRVVRRKVAA